MGPPRARRRARRRGGSRAGPLPGPDVLGPVVAPVVGADDQADGAVAQADGAHHLGAGAEVEGSAPRVQGPGRREGRPARGAAVAVPQDAAAAGLEQVELTTGAEVHRAHLAAVALRIVAEARQPAGAVESGPAGVPVDARCSRKAPPSWPRQHSSRSSRPRPYQSTASTTVCRPTWRSPVASVAPKLSASPAPTKGTGRPGGLPGGGRSPSSRETVAAATGAARPGGLEGQHAAPAVERVAVHAERQGTAGVSEGPGVEVEPSQRGRPRRC